ncbi:hypothetical protein Anapl_10883 [Anas platyrhynchos]|uniref:Uncharacterized protein n=1 Tax=Anas platyrhynchos TaxID=8839 RepID=R0JHP1_ANAPL|nr:hypothetical protein Anapl_10883 [Anas platyrhynchos]
MHIVLLQPPAPSAPLLRTLLLPTPSRVATAVMGLGQRFRRRARLDYILASAGISPISLGHVGCSSLVFCGCKPHAWANSSAGAAEQPPLSAEQRRPQAEQNIPWRDPDRLPAFSSLLSGAFTFSQKSPELHFSPCRKPDLSVPDERPGRRAWGCGDIPVMVRLRGSASK